MAISQQKHAILERYPHELSGGQIQTGDDCDGN